MSQSHSTARAVPTVIVLRAARERISEPTRWCRHSGAMTAHGVTRCDDLQAVRWCALGAIGRAALDAGLYESKDLLAFTNAEAYPGQKELIESLDRLSTRMFPGTGATMLQHVNDSIGREAAISVLDAAIDELVRSAGKEGG